MAHQLSKIVDIRLKNLVATGFLRILPNINNELTDNQKNEIQAHLTRLNERLTKVVIEELKKTKSDIVKSLPQTARERLTVILNDYEYQKPVRFNLVYLEQYFYRKVRK